MTHRSTEWGNPGCAKLAAVLIALPLLVLGGLAVLIVRSFA